MQRGRNNMMLFLSGRAWHGVQTNAAYGGGRYSAREDEVHAPSLRKTPCAVDAPRDEGETNELTRRTNTDKSIHLKVGFGERM